MPSLPEEWGGAFGYAAEKKGVTYADPRQSSTYLPEAQAQTR
jgi:hypothetical protein